jgi:hypothetical protein
MLLMSSSSLDDGVLEEIDEARVAPNTVLPISLQVPLEELDVVEHVDFFLVKDDFILPPPTFPVTDCSNIGGGEFAVPIICPELLMILRGVADILIGVNKVAGVDSPAKENGVEGIVLLLFSIFMLKH